MRSIAFAVRFRCLAERCEDTCCKGWNIEVDEATAKKYAKERDLRSVTYQNDIGVVMCHKANSDECTTYQDGRCAIQTRYGEEYLSDTCYYYPRILHGFGEEMLVSANLSCPEITKEALFCKEDFSLQTIEEKRFPQTYNQHLPNNMLPETAIALHRQLICAVLDSDSSPERWMSRLSALAYTLETVEHSAWQATISFHLMRQDNWMPEPAISPEDPFFLLHDLLTIAVERETQYHPRLYQTIREMERALCVTLHWTEHSIIIDEASHKAWKTAQTAWIGYAPFFVKTLHRWIAAQLSLVVFPFSGLGNNVREHVVLLGVHFATMRLALICACHLAGKIIEESEQVRIIQTIARVLDHRSHPSLSLETYYQHGWHKEARLRALVGDTSLCT